MSNGTVKWFNFTKGFGFITPDSGGKDAFVHITEVERAGMAPLVEGQRIQYEEVNDTRGLKAVSLVAAEWRWGGEETIRFVIRVIIAVHWLEFLQWIDASKVLLCSLPAFKVWRSFRHKGAAPFNIIFAIKTFAHRGVASGQITLVRIF